MAMEASEYPALYLGKSANEVRCALVQDDAFRLIRVWGLDESCGRCEWVLKHRVDLGQALARKMMYRREETGERWVLDDVNNGGASDDDEEE
ncbi:hypothetical protein ZWY2020_008783 [Hordeum vulgare]|nr:hypothetical protein ZWY2020_008783 [Hordeum vulgare]